MFTKKVFISSLSIMFALSGISVVQAQNTGEQKTNSDISELLTLDENNSEFLKTLMKDGYAELGRYKVEKSKIMFIIGMKEQRNFLVEQLMKMGQ